LDELRFSAGQVYKDKFTAPGSFREQYTFREGVNQLHKGPRLLFDKQQSTSEVIKLADRKHLFIDDAIIDKMEYVTFSVNPPRMAERVIDNIKGSFRKHLSILEDENGLIRLYNGVYNDYLAVRTSRDGIHWEMPDLGRGEYKGLKNIVISEAVGTGSVFIDPNAPPDRKWKYVSGFDDRGIYLYSSPDGWSFKRHKTAVLPFRSGSQSNVFYDEQRQVYVGYHRSDCVATAAGATARTFVMTEVRDILNPWPFQPVYTTTNKYFDLKDPQPGYLDNGPLTPCGFCQEYRFVFFSEPFDPVGTDIYVPKAVKYAWAPDTYVAFPIVYFHYRKDGPPTRQILTHPDRIRGSGPIETQLSISRDGINWKRYPRPVYVGNGRHQGWPVNQAYMAHGMVRRGDEIWQYYFGTEIYHSTYSEDQSKNAVYRVIQRVDGFVSADTPYDKEGYIITKPLVFQGNRLVLNIDTDATGYTQVGLLDARGEEIDGYSVNDCIYINGDFIVTEVEWLNKGSDISSLQGKRVQIVFRMRGSKLYAMQFVP
jgi:hypothetical protein